MKKISYVLRLSALFFLIIPAACAPIIYQGVSNTFAVFNVEREVVSGAEFSFGDGSSATGNTVIHTYAKAGDYLVKVSFVTDEGEKLDLEGKIKVIACSKPSTEKYAINNYRTTHERSEIAISKALPDNSGDLPGTFGDNDPKEWIFRHSIDYGDEASLTIFINPEKIPAGSETEISYRIGIAGTWKTEKIGKSNALSIPGIIYGEVVSYYATARKDGGSIKIAAKTRCYNSDAGCCMLQINGPHR